MDTRIRRIVVAIDGSDQGKLAAETAGNLAVRSLAELHLVHVWAPVGLAKYSVPRTPSSSDVKALEESARGILTDEAHRLAAAGMEVDAVHLREGRPADEIVRVCDETGADILVIGSHGKGMLRRIVLGSVAESSLQRADCPVLIARSAEQSWPPSRIVVGDDGSSAAQDAALLALQLGQLYEAPVHLVHALPEPPLALAIDRQMRDDVVHYVEAFMETRVRALRERSPARLTVNASFGDPGAALMARPESSRQPALLVVGRSRRHREPVERLGTVTSAVIHIYRGPVLVYPARLEA